jgi:hypothetical protein
MFISLSKGGEGFAKPNMNIHPEKNTLQIILHSANPDSGNE